MAWAEEAWQGASPLSGLDPAYTLTPASRTRELSLPSAVFCNNSQSLRLFSLHQTPHSCPVPPSSQYVRVLVSTLLSLVETLRQILEILGPVNLCDCVLFLLKPWN